MDREKLESERQMLITEEGARPLRGFGTYLEIKRADGIHILEPNESGVYSTRSILDPAMRRIKESYV